MKDLFESVEDYPELIKSSYMAETSQNFTDAIDSDKEA